MTWLTLSLLLYNLVTVSLQSVLVTIQCVLVVPIRFDSGTNTIHIVTNTLCRKAVTISYSNSDKLARVLKFQL